MLSASRTRPVNVKMNPIHPWLSSASVAFNWLQLMHDPSPRVHYPVQAPQQLPQVASPISVPRSIVRIYAASTIKGAKFSSEVVPMYAVARLAGSGPVPTSNYQGTFRSYFPLLLQPTPSARFGRDSAVGAALAELLHPEEPLRPKA